MKNLFILISLCASFCLCLTTGTLQAQNVGITIFTSSEKKPISPYIYGKNNSLSGNSADPLTSAEWQRLRDMGILFFRENGGNNATKYNWRRKLSSHPDWYNNVYGNNWDFAALSLGSNIPSAQGMWAFQLAGKAAKTSSANFNDWAYNNSAWWEGCGQNLAGGGTVNPAGGGDALVEGDPSLYLEDWNADSTTGILDHWFGNNSIGLDKEKIRYWSMDNEPEIWSGTHDDIWPNQPTAEEFMQMYFAVAKKARAKYPGIKLVGPVPANEWQWYNWDGGKITYKGKQYPWLEYFILRIAEEQKLTGIRLLDVLDIHFYPGETASQDITQLHRVFFDTTYNYPGANGVKRLGAGGWDNSITKEYIFKRCSDWLKKYVGEGHGVTFSVSEISLADRSNPTLTANWYASMLGEFAKNGVELFTPWDWSTGMAEVVHLFTHYGQKYYVPSFSTDENSVSAFPTINESGDSLTIFLVNRHLSDPNIVNMSISDFYIKDGTYKLYTISGLPSTETFQSASNNALKETSVVINGNAIGFELPALSVSALVVPRNNVVYNKFGRLLVTSGNFDGASDSIKISVNVDRKDLYRIVVHYSSPGAGEDHLTVNGLFTAGIGLPASGDVQPADAGCFVLEAGTNRIDLSRFSGQPVIEKIEIYAIEAKTYSIDQALTDHAANNETKALYNFLQYQFGNRIISGQTSDFYNDVKSLTGKSPMIRDGDFQHFSQGYAYFWVNGIGHTFGYDVNDHSVDSMINWYNSTGKKGIVAMQWHWHSPLYGVSAGKNTFYTDLTSFDIRQAVIPGTPEYNATIRDIDSIATQLKKFSKAGIPVLWRPLHEAGGAWFWWGAKGAEPCLALWDILRDRLINYHQLHNLIWVWSTPEPAWYPGNDKVDIIGYDSYPGNFNYSNRKEIYDNLYMITLGRKMIAMSENGPVPYPDSCLQKDAPWLYFTSWSSLVTQQNSAEHLQHVFDHPMVLSIESGNAKSGFDWRSSLYPDNWTPGYKDSQGRFLHDFSYAGYHMGETEVPHLTENIINVTHAPYLADSTGSSDATTAIQQALNDAGKAGGGVVFLPKGKYLVHASDTFALKIAYDHVVLRGAGPGLTFIKNASTVMRYKDIIRVKNSGRSWFTPKSPSSLLKFDLAEPTRVIPVQSVTGFTAGDPVILTSTPTSEFIAEHKMTGNWTADGIKGVAFMRRIDSIDTKNNLIIVDAPTKYPLKTRDQARIYKISEPLKESGIENLSLGNIANTGSGWDEESYSQTGTGAYEVHFAQAIHFINAENCWVRNVHTFRPSENAGDFHLLSNGVKLNQCRFVTIDSCVFEKSQYEGGGGNGYMFTLEANDCLIKNTTANHGRHNYDFKYPYSNGNVILRCRAENSKYASDFHMYLSMANLFDECTLNGDYLESAFRPYGNPLHGYSSTQSVFYNTRGESYHPSRNYLIESKQFGYGYIIGTSGPAFDVLVDPAEGIMNGYIYNTLPRDFTEGIGKGADLFPQSLYLDQLTRRRNNPQQGTDFKIRIIARDAVTKQVIPDCNITIYTETIQTDEVGTASFNQVPAFFVVNASKAYYSSVENEQHFVHTDSVFTVYLDRLKYNVTIRLLRTGTEEPVSLTTFNLGNTGQVTDANGNTVFNGLYGGPVNYSLMKPYYQPETGILTVRSDTTVIFYLVKTEANLRIRLRNGSTPVNNAFVVVNEDTVKTNSLGDAVFSHVPVPLNYSYSIAKSGFQDMSGTIYVTDDTIFVVAMNPAVSAGENEKSGISLWPNPASDLLFVRTPPEAAGGKIVITDLRGTRIFNCIIAGPETRIQVDSFAEGNYILSIVLKDQTIIRNISIIKN